MWSLVAVLSSAVACVASCGCIACLLSVSWYPCRSCGRLVVTVIRDVHTVATVGTFRRPDTRPSGGGRFFKKGGEADRNPPRPHFYARGQKKCDFQAQTEVKQLRKRRKGVLWCDFGQLIWLSMLFLVLFGWLRWLCSVVFGSQWVFLVERRKRKSRSRDRGYVGEVAVNGAGQTDKKQSGLTL